MRMSRVRFLSLALMNKWLLIHRYRQLVRDGQARPFTCPNCGQELTTVPDKDDEPVLWCTYDDEGYTPGVQFWGDVRAVVSEFYLE